MFYLALCAIAKDENQYLREWVEYHRLAGVEHFFIYDNESAIPIKETLRHYIEAGIVTVHEIQGIERQMDAYDDCINTNRKTCRWIGFIDLDEFIVPLQTQDIPSLLIDYENFGGLAMNWSMYGSNGHVARPTVPHIEAYTTRTPLHYYLNHHIKSIVHPQYVMKCTYPHAFQYYPGFDCVNEKYEPSYGPYSGFSGEKVVVNHYFNRSREDFDVKMVRGRADRTDIQYKLDRFERLDRNATIEDTCAHKYLGALKKRLSSDTIVEHRTPAFPFNSSKDFAQQFDQLLQSRDLNSLNHLTRLAIFNHPDKAELWYYRGVILNKLEAYTEAEHALKYSLRLDESAAAYLELVMVLMVQQRTAEARRHLAMIKSRLIMDWKQLHDQLKPVVDKTELLLKSLDAK